MESLRPRVLPFTLFGLAIAGTTATLAGLRQPAAPPPIAQAHEPTQRCRAPLPRIDTPDVVGVEEIDELIAEPADEERALAISTLTTLQRPLEPDDDVTLARIAHSTGMIFGSTDADTYVTTELTTALANLELDPDALLASGIVDPPSVDD